MLSQQTSIWSQYSFFSTCVLFSGFVEWGSSKTWRDRKGPCQVFCPAGGPDTSGKWSSRSQLASWCLSELLVLHVSTLLFYFFRDSISCWNPKLPFDAESRMQIWFWWGSANHMLGFDYLQVIYGSVVFALFFCMHDSWWLIIAFPVFLFYNLTGCSY